ncbi:hypothetical protein [Paenibacillus arenilitoris]|uniref:Uncharacterized protein n=1 Tax=Paenibacillus arenilitoris TaxID=2772299 RepID=A0A927CJF2_9BACL|nr:hypothetical protein [Paenibacillus arenilitoris]MBD2867728.1 hypothetical protein [Paenibacillus arenilitoris]
MKHRKVRILMEAIAAALLAAVVLIALQIASGIYLTATHVPDIIESYEQVDYLQQEMSFGGSAGGPWLYPAAAFVAVGLIYYGIRTFFAARRNR